jgi:hypothetical protein
VSLLERFQAGSQLDSVGEFTLDESKARQKMARFQLTSAEEFLMLVVQAVVAARATRLRLAWGESGLTLRADDVELHPDAVACVSDFLFDSLPENVSYQLLAVALNAVEGACSRPPSLAMEDGCLNFRAPLASPLAALPSLLADRLAYLPCPLELDGVAIATRPLSSDIELELQPGELTHLSLVRHGVIVARQKLTMPIPARAVARADDLALDASFSHVVEDEGYQGLLAAVQQAANEALAEQARGHQPGDLGSGSLLAHVGKKHPDPAGRALAECPLFPLADRSGWASLQELLALARDEGKVLVGSRRFNLQLDLPVVLVEDRQVLALVHALLPTSALQNAEGAYSQRLQAEKNRQAWESSPRPTELPPGRYIASARLDRPAWEAALGYLAAPGGARRMDVLYQGKLFSNESLADLPPGATAVLNMRKAQVDATWTHLDGRDYRAARRELVGQLRTLFDQLELKGPQDLYPELELFLLKDLAAKNPAKLSLGTPLFFTSSDRAYSMQELSRWPEVPVGDPCMLSDRIPASLLPSNMVVYSEERLSALRARLGDRVKDLRSFQEHLGKIDRQMASPAPATLPEQDYLDQRGLKLGEAHGALGILPRQGKLSLTLLHRGVLFESRSLPANKVLEMAVVLEAPQLVPNEQWTGVVHDQAYEELLSELRLELARAERALLELTELPPSLRLPLLQAYPQPEESYWELPLFASTVRGQLLSLARLQDDLQRHGGLLRGRSGICHPERPALLSPAPQEEAFLQEALGPIAWQDAAAAVQRLEQARAFERRPVLRKIALLGAYPVRKALQREGRGEIGLGVAGPGERFGQLNCYAQGRFVCRKGSVIPHPFVAAVESEGFALSSDFSDVTVPEALRLELLELGGECMLEAARQGNRALQEVAWQYFTSKQPSEAHLQAFLEEQTLPLLGGSQKTLKSLGASKILGYVRPEFSLSATSSSVVLRLGDEQARRVARLLGKTLNNVEKAVEQEQSWQQALARVPLDICQGRPSRAFQEGDCSAVLAVGLPRLTVGVDSQGRAAGYLRPLYLPVRALAHGATARKMDDRQRPVAQISNQLERRLADWADQLCLDWVRALGPRLTAEDLEVAEALLLATMREIGSRNTRPQAEMASLLWELPLFEMVDRTRLSGTALACRLQSNGQPLQAVENAFRAPDDALLMDPSAPACTILRFVLGKDAVVRYEAPPLIDPAGLARSVRGLVAWGLAPVGAAWSKAKAFLDMEIPLPSLDTEISLPSLRWRAEASQDAETDAPEKWSLDRRKKRDKPEKRRQREPAEVLLVSLKEDVRNLLGAKQFRDSDDLFRNLAYGAWPLGPPIYLPGSGPPYKLNTLHPAIRWLVSEGGDARAKRIARMLLVVHWVGLVNVASEQLEDAHEENFLVRLADRMGQTLS